MGFFFPNQTSPQPFTFIFYGLQLIYFKTDAMKIVISGTDSHGNRSSFKNVIILNILMHCKNVINKIVFNRGGAWINIPGYIF